jgi:UPF0716 protein FxsA
LLPLLVLIFILVPIAELAVIIQIGQAIGVWWTVALLLADSILGSLLMRAQGRTAWRRFTEALQAGRPPAREVVDGAFVLLGGALLVTPGFLSDIFGLLLLAPPSRAVIRRLLLRRVMHRMTIAMVGGAGGRTVPPPGPGDGRSPRQDYDVEGTAHDQ